MKRKLITTTRVIMFGFLIGALLGSVLLMLPISLKHGIQLDYIDALFVSVSSICVTGLSTVNIGETFSLFGQLILLLIIQMGGLGVVTFTTMLLVIFRQKITLKDRILIQNAYNLDTLTGLVKLTLRIVKVTLIIEGIGAFFYCFVFVPQYGKLGLWYAIFHSVSAFCNAGFDLMGTKTGHFSSLTSFSDSIYATVIFCFLIIAGGVGFLTWEDIATKKTKFKQYRMQSKVIIWTSIILVVVPAVIFFFVDFADTPLKERFCASIFQAVSPRTAGFNTEDYSNMKDSGRAITMILMLIGGSPGSTAGGMKTTTIAILFANAIAVFRMRRNANYFGRRIEDSVVKNAATILFMYLFLSISGALVMGIVESIPLESCMFETMSAIATVGLTVGITQQIGIVSQIILILLMFFGRVGGLTIIYAAFSPKDTYASKYPVENIMVG